jgi:hypothetical protein
VSSFTPDRVVLDMPRATWERLIWALGVATGAASRDDRASATRFLALVNELNEGNPQWLPYAVDEELTRGNGARVTHRARHVELHRAFDELLADYLLHVPGSLPSKITATDLMTWSHAQTIAPTDDGGRA